MTAMKQQKIKLWDSKALLLGALFLDILCGQRVSINRGVYIQVHHF
jgi:hypothetical protein